jgi:hypothetical protein
MSLSEHVLLMRDSLLAPTKTPLKKLPNRLLTTLLKQLLICLCNNCRVVISNGRVFAFVSPNLRKGFCSNTLRRGLDTVSAMAIWQRLQVRR